MKLFILLLASVTTVLAVSNLNEERVDEPSIDRGKILFGSVSTQSHTLVSFTTSTVFFSCFNGVSTDSSEVTVCPGRRKRRRRSLQTTNLFNDGMDTVQSSQFSDVQADNKDQSGKLFFTVWTKSVATTTLTTFFTNSDTTLSLSYFCSLGAVNTPAAPC